MCKKSQKSFNCVRIRIEFILILESGNLSGESEKNDVEQMHYRENKMNGRNRKQGMKRDEETVCRDLKGEEG